MFVLGLQGSPRIKGNTSLLLSSFLNEAEALGARTLHLDVARRNISPCLECGNCEKEGMCPLDDDMQRIFPLLWQAHLVVMATPVFFYGPTAQMKALIDRCQTLWARKYVHKLEDPGRRWRQGFLLSLGATKGQNLFEGVELTAKYFFDAVGATQKGSLTYRKIEAEGDVKRHPSALSEARDKARLLVGPWLKKKKVLFVSKENACRSQMASAFAQYHGGDSMSPASAGSAPAREVHPAMTEVMGERGLDMAFRQPLSMEDQTLHMKPELIISMGCEEASALLPGVPAETWDLPSPEGRSKEFIRQLREDIEKRVERLLADTGP